VSPTLAAPPRWAIPHPTPERQLGELRAQYPDALAWYGEKSGRWFAAPTGADELIQAHTAAGLAVLLEQHYKRMIPQTPRPAPACPTHRRTPGGDQTPRPIRTARTRPAGGDSTPTGHGRHEANRRPSRFRRGVSWLGLIADAA
jgi:hypothetical protein